MIEKLRYPSFDNNKELIRFVAKLLDIPASMTDLSDQDKCAMAMSGVIMYRQLDRIEKMQVMEVIYSLPNKRLVSKLLEKITDITVQPRWGKWSLSNEELQEIIDFHSKFGMISNVAGFNPGLYGAAGSGWSLIKKLRAGVGGSALRYNIVTFTVSIVLLGLSLISADQLALATEERERRRVFAK